MTARAAELSLSPSALEQIPRLDPGNMGTILFGLGTLALEAGARTISITITRDDSGRPRNLFCSHDGRAPDEATLQSLLGAAGAAESKLNLLPPATAAEQLEIATRGQPSATIVRWDPGTARLAADSATVASDLPSGEPVVFVARGLRTDMQDVRIVGALQRLPLGRNLTVYLDDGAGRAPVSTRTYAGSLLTEGDLPFAWREAGEEHKGSVRYRLSLLDSVPKGRVRSAAPGVDIIQGETVAYRGTLGLPVRTTNLGRLSGWFQTGNWFEYQPGSLRLANRGPTRAFLKAARQLILGTLGEARIEGRRDPRWLARLSSDLTQRLSKAVRGRPELAPIHEKKQETGERWDVLDIPYRAGTSDAESKLRLGRPGIRVDFSLSDGPDDPPARWEPSDMIVMINARHRSAPTTAKLFRAWSLQMASLTLASLRPGGHRFREAIASGTALVGQASSASATPASTRSQRELRKRKKAEARLAKEAAAR
ncbi:MAG TPA: hypothetical protein QGH28_07265 [Chloroflexota bacterium]|nr:hypothetical protein [Chloroflexota bacterium]